MLELEQDIRQYETDDFSVYFRANAMKKMHHKKCYSECYGLPFMTHIDAKGNVWPCVAHIGTEEFCYGNIYEQTFEEMWEGNKRKQILRSQQSVGSLIDHISREEHRE